MAVTATNLTAGPGTLYVGSFGATEPADSAVNAVPSASTWTDVGGTQDGVTATISREFLEMDVDQIVMTPGRRLQALDLTVKTNLAEPTLANLLVALNNGASAASAAFATFDPVIDTTATQPTYRAIILDGWAPQTAAAVSMRRRIIVRKVLSTEDVETSYKKDGQTLIPVTFSAHYVSSSILPFHIVDQLT